jgi:hypothetical protein
MNRIVAMRIERSLAVISQLLSLFFRTGVTNEKEQNL